MSVSGVHNFIPIALKMQTSIIFAPPPFTKQSLILGNSCTSCFRLKKKEREDKRKGGHVLNITIPAVLVLVAIVMPLALVVPLVSETGCPPRALSGLPEDVELLVAGGGGRALGLSEPALLPPLAAHHDTEHHAGVEHVHHHHGNEDHDRLERDEEILPRHEGAVPALGQLRDTEARPPEDGNGADRERDHDGLEHEPLTDGLGRLGLLEPGVGSVGLFAVADPEEELARHGEEDGEDEDLEGETGDHDVVAHVEEVDVVRGGGDATSRGLEDKRDDVAGDELVLVSTLAFQDVKKKLGRATHDAGIPTGGQPAALLTIDAHHLGQASVDTCSQKRRSNRQSHNLNHEAHVVPGVLGRCGSPGVTDDFTQQPKTHHDGEKGALAAGAEVGDDEGDEGDAEEGGEDGVGGEGGDLFPDALDGRLGVEAELSCCGGAVFLPRVVAFGSRPVVVFVDGGGHCGCWWW